MTPDLMYHLNLTLVMASGLASLGEGRRPGGHTLLSASMWGLFGPTCLGVDGPAWMVEG
jgi:hypothetical protein